MFILQDYDDDNYVPLFVRLTDFALRVSEVSNNPSSPYNPYHSKNSTLNENCELK